jgi:MoaA/NifB/PqqE/SkfB family radical SAM enzyme
MQTKDNQIVRIENTQPNEWLSIHYAVHNVCNFKCWYCFPGSNSGEYRWPDLDLISKNFIHLIEHYRTTQGKTKFELKLLGGEPTVWPELGDFIRILKEKYADDILIKVFTNGSRTIRWWGENAKYFDSVLISGHPAEIDQEHTRTVADLLYEKNVYVDFNMMMDPHRWDQSISIIEYLKGSKYQWSIIAAHLRHDSFTYTEEQMNYIRDHVKRQADKTYHENSKHFKSSVIVHRADGTSEPVNKNYIVLNDLNHFEGWECSVGVENLSIQFDGAIMANCGTNVYGLDYRFNLNDADFVTKFTPEIKPVICPKYSCDSHEYNLNKRVIPIIALT